MSGWTIIVIALMVILTVAFVAYPLYSAGGISPASSPCSPPVRKARKKRRADEALEMDLEEEIERQVRALRRKK